MAVTSYPGVATFAAVCTSVTIAACCASCSSDNFFVDTPPTSSPSTSWSTSIKPTTESTAEADDQLQAPRNLQSEPGSANYTIAQYIGDQHIAETPIHPGDPGAPQISVEFPSGWIPGGPGAPETAYGALVYTAPEAEGLAYPPNIVAMLSKLDGNVDPEKLIEFAGGEVKNLPGFVGVFDEPASVSGNPAYRIAGIYDFEGVKAAAAQETVVISGSGGLYVLQLNATSNEPQAGTLFDGLTASVNSMDIAS
jgi:hypothetical protein